MQTRPKPLLVVAKPATSILLNGKKTVITIADLTRIFPAIHEFKPTGIVLDYDYIGTETEKILRRLKSNPFYNKIKISCYKSRPHTRIDDLLKTLGVVEFIYADTPQPSKAKISIKALSRLMETNVANTLVEATY